MRRLLWADFISNRDGAFLLFIMEACGISLAVEQFNDRKVKVLDRLDHIDELVKVNGLGDVRVGIQSISVQQILLIV